MKKNKGITLIALVVTIIVLLILAGISIATLTGTNGILTRANDAKVENVKGTEREQIKLAYGTEKSFLLEKGSTESVKAEDLENRLKSDGANVTSVEEEDGSLKVTFDTGNIYYVDIEGNITDGTPVEPPTPPVIGEVEQPTEKTDIEFNRANGVIEIAWLDMNNNVIKNPLKITDNDLGGMSPVKWDGIPGNYEEKTTSVSDSSWYQYKAQTGNTEVEGTSRWANAKAISGENEAYFVWIPRYSYKIIYFDTPTNKENYRMDNTKQTGIVGYSTRHGMIDITSGTPKILEGTEPVNITGVVKTSGYQDYIPHPAFEFDGAQKGIWIGKYEPSGSTSAVTIKPNVSSLRNQTVSNMFLASQGVKSSYALNETSDTHMMKNIEWGAVAYLTESKYGRNGTKITINNSSSFITGSAGNTISAGYQNETTNSYNTQKGILASTTGNIYGIYDLSGGAVEAVAAYINVTYTQSNRYIKNLIEAVAVNPKYADIYSASNNNESNNYYENKNKYGDGIYETSTSYKDNNGWNSENSAYPFYIYIIFNRGGTYSEGATAGCFHSTFSEGINNQAISFRVVLAKNP